MGDGTAASAIKYLDNLVEKGKASKGAISPLKIAFTKVLQTIDGKDAWLATEVRDVDVDDYMNRFANLTMGKYSSESLTVYKSRMKKVVDWYVMFLDKPGWAPEIQRRNRPVRPVGDEAGATTVSAPSSVASTTSAPHAAPAALTVAASGLPSAADRITYPYPLLDGQLIHISLPVNLGKIDARRIGAFVESIARDDDAA